MTLRTVITNALIVISIPVMVLWKYWEGQYYDANFWVSGYDYPLNIQWYVLFLSWHLRDLAMSYVIYRMSFKIRAIRVIAVANLVYSIIDAVLFFWSFNRGKDVLLVHFTITLAVSILFAYWPKIKQAFVSYFARY